MDQDRQDRIHQLLEIEEMVRLHPSLLATKTQVLKELQEINSELEKEQADAKRVEADRVLAGPKAMPRSARPEGEPAQRQEDIDDAKCGLLPKYTPPIYPPGSGPDESNTQRRAP